MSSMTITELRRVGASILEETPIKFVWDSRNHSMIQDTLDLELQVNTTRETPPGADEPVEHVQSVEWSPIEMHGEWKDQWAGQGFADRTYVEFARMCGRVPLVRIELDRHSLVGLITKFKIKWRTRFEIGYGFTFSVHRNETIGTFRATEIIEKSAINFSQRIQTQRDALDRIDDTTTQAKRLPLSTEDLVDTLDNLDDLTASVDNAQFATDAVAFESPQSLDFLETIDRAQHKLLAVAAAFAGVRNQAESNLQDVNELVSTDLLAYDDVVNTLRFEEWTRTQQIECTRMIGEARAGERDARDRAARRPRGVHRVRHGDTLDRISVKWYGTPDSARFIRDVNNLDSIVLPVGVDLIIPDVSR